MTLTIDDFTRAYITCALWSTVNEDVYSKTGIDEHLDARYDIDDIAPDTLAQIVKDCDTFREQNEEALSEAYATEGYGDRYASDGQYYTAAEFAGHDFWLTRNHHGAGFWDRGLGKVGDVLTEASHKFKECDLYVGDDGKIHGA